MARGWSLDELAARCHLSPSTLSRIETGHRRIALDQLAPIARVLGTTLDQLVESADDDDVVIRPHRDEVRGRTTWLLSRESGPNGVTVAKMRITKPVVRGTVELGVHPGTDLGDRLPRSMSRHDGDAHHAQQRNATGGDPQDPRTGADRQLKNNRIASSDSHGPRRPPASRVVLRRARSEFTG